MHTETTTPVWELYRDGITQSMLQSFLKCKERFRLSNVEGLKLGGVRSTAALDFGELFHRILEVVYGAFGEAEDKAKFVADIPRMVEEFIDKSYDAALEEYKEMPKGVEAFEAMQLKYVAAHELAVGYFEFHEKDWEELQWVELEKVFDIPYKTLRGNTIRIRGKRDGGFRSRGGLYLFETKTKGRIDNEFIIDTLGFDLQVGIYSDSLEYDYQEVPAGCLYNVARRPQLKRKYNESLTDFRERIRAHIASDPEHYYLRFPVTFSEDERSRWKNEFAHIVDELESWNEGQYRYRNQASCQTIYGSCPFLRLCSSGDTSLYRRREGMFLELTGDSDEATS